jgi:hypothetical protein
MIKFSVTDVTADLDSFCLLKFLSGNSIADYFQNRFYVKRNSPTVFLTKENLAAKFFIHFVFEFLFTRKKI